MRHLLLVLLLPLAAMGEDLGLGPVPTNVALLAPGPIGSTTPNTGAFTTLSASGAETLSNVLSQSFTFTDTFTNAVSGTYVYRMTASATNNAKGITIALKPTIVTGQTQSGAVYGASIQAQRNLDSGASNDNGTFGTLGAMQILSGHGSSIGGSTPATGTCYGINLIPQCNTGTITTLYDLRLQALTGAGTVTTHNAISQEDTTAVNTFAGVSTFSSSTASTTTGTGAVVVTGGEGVGGALTVGGAIASAGSVKSSSATAGVGYATGAGGTVAQSSSKATTVVLNTVCGTITMNAAALASVTSVAFTLTDSAIAATDLVVCHHDSVGTLGGYNVVVTPASGSATITVRNMTAGSLSEAIVLRFAVIKATTN